MTGYCFVCRQLSLNKPFKNRGDEEALKGLKWDYVRTSSVGKTFTAELMVAGLIDH